MSNTQGSRKAPTAITFGLESLQSLELSVDGSGLTRISFNGRLISTSSLSGLPELQLNLPLSVKDSQSWREWKVFISVHKV